MEVVLPYKPHATQLPIHLDAHRYKVVCCGRRWGKSAFALNEIIDKALRKPGRYWIIAPSYVQAKNIYWRDNQRGLRHWLPDALIKRKNETELYVELKNGSLIELKGADNEDSLRGTGLDGVVLDEFADFSPTVWTHIVRPMLLDTNGWAIFIGTPKGYNHFYEAFLNEQKLPDWKSYQHPSHDNPLLNKTLLKELETEAKESGEDVYYQEILAEFRKPTGAVYKEFDRKRQVRPLPYNPALPLYIAWDFGVRDPTAILWLQRSMAGEIYLVDCYEGTDSNIEHYLQVVNAKPYKTAVMHCGDPAGYQRELGTGISVADALRKNGIHLKVRPGMDKQTMIRTTHGVVQRLYVNQECDKFVQSIESYHYPKERSNAMNPTTETPVHDWSSHMMDALSYFAVNEPIGRNVEIDRAVRARAARLRSDPDWIN